ncbi:MAG: murein biosynthesis integral membrane protein MurJ [Candidatus Levybacteria bacterium RIFCSPHIGHO2_02_FULL_42_12]|nr:MAG: murein biosynthesis integral membrane protein MurJ [Candidatus Levybacteria bacterium RIFCSPHIGHO2_02_FULL_42_12]OGH43070.1 MAG: murein biosynthesis integral membrane protein MurJ [Candidatus Levybacteria bacterium RIFCSPLOWO2_01_FULL_42_15]
MQGNLLQKGIDIFLKRQTNILSAAFVIMATVLLSQFLGIIRQRLLVSVFGASDTLGVYLAATRLPDFIFQLIIAGALSSAFIPVFSDFLTKGKEKEAHKMASTLLMLGMLLFASVALVLFIMAPFFLKVFNLGLGFSPTQMELMVHIMRIIIFGQFIFIVGTFFSALLQSYNHFFIPGFAAGMYNLGIIIALITLPPVLGIFAPAVGVLFGAFLFVLFQLPMVATVGFHFRPSFSLRIEGVMQVVKLMWPRTLAIGIFQMGALVTLSLISFLPSSGRNYVIFDYAQTLAFAPIVLFGQAIAQAVFPVLSREKDRLEEFKRTFITSFNQILYLILPVSVLFLVLRIPIVRLVFGVAEFDWGATVLTGKTLAYFSVSMFAQSLVYLASRGFYALHNTKIPLIVGGIATGAMLVLGGVFILIYHWGVESIAIAYSFASIVHFIMLLFLLDKKVGGFEKRVLLVSAAKIGLASLCTGFALYIPIKLLDQLVFDTTRTINLLILTGISSCAGISLYVFLTWFFNVPEATTFLVLFRRIGNWKEVLGKTEEIIDTTTVKP